MTDRARLALLTTVFFIGCSSPGASLFSPVDSGSGGSSTAGSGGSATAGSGAASTGGSSMNGGEGSGAAPTAGSAGSGGSVPDGDGGADSNPMTGTGGADDGMAGAPPDPPDPPVCGNGKLEEGEECDDMGHEGQDGCNANCEVVCSHFGEDAVESADHHCYNGYDSFNFANAQADCVDRGAHLVTIASDTENEIAASFVANSKFIGGFEAVDGQMIDEMDNSQGTYEWVTGEAFSYDNWGNEQPDRDAGRCSGFSGPNCYAHCAAMNGQGTWMAQRCDESDGYICEWEPAGD